MGNMRFLCEVFAKMGLSSVCTLYRVVSWASAPEDLVNNSTKMSGGLVNFLHPVVGEVRGNGRPSSVHSGCLFV